jgi:hypothetical protein
MRRLPIDKGFHGSGPDVGQTDQQAKPELPGTQPTLENCEWHGFSLTQTIFLKYAAIKTSAAQYNTNPPKLQRARSNILTGAAAGNLSIASKYRGIRRAHQPVVKMLDAVSTMIAVIAHFR